MNVLSKQNPTIHFDPNDGFFILVDKEKDWTSFDVVAKLRGILKRYTSNKKLKVGHAGTLDPAATGLLVVAVGKKATSQISRVQDLAKRYTGRFKLGVTTPSYDAETEIDQYFPTQHIDKKLLDETIPGFVGTIQQIPPMYSAIKVKGQRLYTLARKGKEIEREPRTVVVYSFVASLEHDCEVAFDILCGKGTYIRSLAFDLGKALQSGGYLKILRRESIGEFDVRDAFSVAEIERIFQPD